MMIRPILVRIQLYMYAPAKNQLDDLVGGKSRRTRAQRKGTHISYASDQTRRLWQITPIEKGTAAAYIHSGSNNATNEPTY
jgi:hypothetical protein